MLNTHSWYTFNFECAYKKPSFIKVTVFFSDAILVSNYQQSNRETMKLLSYYLYDRYFIYKTVKIYITFEKNYKSSKI